MISAVRHRESSEHPTLHRLTFNIECPVFLISADVSWKPSLCLGCCWPVTSSQHPRGSAVTANGKLLALALYSDSGHSLVMAPEVHMYSVVLWRAGSDRRFSSVICTSPPTLTLPDPFIDRHGIVEVDLRS